MNTPIHLSTAPARAGDSTLLAPAGSPVHSAQFVQNPHSLDPARVGTELLGPGGQPLFRLVGKCRLPEPAGHSAVAWHALALADEPGKRDISCTARREGWALAWITLSDKGAAGQREDQSGPLIAELCAAALPLCHSQGFLLPDDERQLRALLTDLSLFQGYDLILTTGGTGLSSRDVTPEATLALIERRLPGIEQAMMRASLAKTPNAIISRAVAGTAGTSLIVNLPGSVKAVRENLESILPGLAHLLDKLAGSPVDCGAL